MCSSVITHSNDGDDDGYDGYDAGEGSGLLNEDLASL
jgi:hypothetical protein